MSFTFRNLFSEEDGAPGAEPAGSGPSADNRNAPDAGHGERGEAAGSASASPTPAVKGQAFQVNELLPFIPPAISAESGIPMEKEVLIPMPSDGSGDVALSTIYQIVPELFAAEITPLNDSRVTLPTKLGGVIGEPAPAGGFSSGSIAKPAAAGNAFSGGGEEGNPFWSPAADEAPVGAKTTAPAEKALPDHDVPTQEKPESAFGAPEKEEENPFAEFEDIMPGGQEVEVSIPAGFDSPESKERDEVPGQPPETGDSAPAKQSPGFGEGANPFADLSSSDEAPPSSPKSEVGAPAGLNPFESDAGFSTLFSRQADEDSDIPFPESGDEKATDETSGDSWGAMFDADLTPAAEEEAGDESSSSATPPAGDPKGLPQGFEQGFGDMINQSRVEEKAPPPAKDEEAPAASSPAGSLPSGFQSFNPATPSADSVDLPESPEIETATHAKADEEPVEIAPEPKEEEQVPSSGFSAFPDFAPIEEPEGNDTKRDVWGDEGENSPEPNFQVDDLGIATPAPEKVAADEDSGLFGDDSTMKASEPRIQVEAVASSSSASPLMENPLQEGADVSLRDLELRAIFSTDERFTLATVARKIVGLEGIDGCALATRSKLVQASRTEQSSLGTEAREMIGTIRNLAKLTGLPEARSFTLHTDRGTVSLFLEGDCCVTVNHSSAGFSPGVKEKLILIARSIHKIEE